MLRLRAKYDKNIYCANKTGEEAETEKKTATKQQTLFTTTDNTPTAHIVRSQFVSPRSTQKLGPVGRLVGRFMVAVLKLTRAKEQISAGRRRLTARPTPEAATGPDTKWICYACVRGKTHFG